MRARTEFEKGDGESSLSSAIRALDLDFSNFESFKKIISHQLLFEVQKLAKNRSDFENLKKKFGHLSSIDSIDCALNKIINQKPSNITEFRTKRDYLLFIWNNFNTLGLPKTSQDQVNRALTESTIFSKLLPSFLKLKQFNLAAASALMVLHSFQTAIIPSTYESLKFKSEVKLDLAHSYYGLGWYSLSRKIIDKILKDQTEKNLTYISALNILGSIEIIEEDYRKAEEILKSCHVLAIGKDLQELAFQIQCNLSLVYRRLGNYEKSLEIHENLYHDFKQKRNLFKAASELGLIALHFAKDKNYEKALEKIEQMKSLCEIDEIQYEYFSLKALFLKDMALSKKPGNSNLLNEVVFSFEKALEFANLLKNSIYIATMHLHLAELNAIRGNDEKAKVYYEKVFDFHEECENMEMFIWNHLSYGFILLKKGAIDQAYDHFLKAEELYSIRTEDKNRDEFLITWPQQFGAKTANKITQLVEISRGNIKKALEIAERDRRRALKVQVSKKMRKKLLVANSPILETGKFLDYAERLKTNIIFFTELFGKYIFAWIIIPGPDKLIRFIPFKSEPLAENIQKLENFDISIVQNDISFRDLRDPKNFRTFTCCNSNSSKEENLLDKYRGISNIWAALENEIKSSNSCDIIIVSDEIIHTFPFPALINSEGTRVVKVNTFSYSPSISSLIQLHRSKENYKRALIIADPLLNIKRNLSQLKAANEEAKLISNVLKEFNQVLLTGCSATKENILKELENVKNFHLAAHSILDQEEDGSVPGSIVVSSSASHTGQKELELSLLKSSDLQALDLSGLELAFLNCCSTGSGKLYQESLVGLRRALIFAGAHSIILTRWPVPDNENTCLFAKMFYENYVNGMKVTRALSETQKAFYELGISEEIWASYYVLEQGQLV